MSVAISVVIPTFNRSASVRNAIESVLNQTYQPKEIVVIDDGSSDDTQNVLNRFGNKIKAIYQPNQGVSTARNVGVHASTGEWVSFLDSDDIWYPNRLAVLARDISESTAGLHVANVTYVGPGYEWDLHKIRGFNFPKDKAAFLKDGLEVALAGLQIDGVAVRRDWVLAVGGMDPTMTFHEDSHFFLKLSRLGPWLITSELVACVHRLPDEKKISLTDQALLKRISTSAMKVRMFEDLLKRGNLSPEQTSLVTRSLSGSLFELAAAQATHDGWAKSLVTLFNSATHHPTMKGWLKILLPLLLGKIGYTKILNRKAGYYREQLQ